MANSPTYQTWADMIGRCRNPNAKQFKNYGGRGISVCDRWLRFDNFLDDMGERPKGLTIERINNDGNYEPLNCRWATRAEQRRNQRGCHHIELDGVRKTIEEWARHAGIAPMTIVRRLANGMSERDSVFLPPDSTRRGLGKGNKSGFIGVSLHKPTGKWAAYFVSDGKQRHVGLFNSASDANIARTAALAKLEQGEPSA